MRTGELVITRGRVILEGGIVVISVTKVSTDWFTDLEQAYGMTESLDSKWQV